MKRTLSPQVPGNERPEGEDPGSRGERAERRPEEEVRRVSGEAPRTEASRRTFGAGASGDGVESEAGTTSDSSQGEFSGQRRSAPGADRSTYGSPQRTYSISPEGERRTAGPAGEEPE